MLVLTRRAGERLVLGEDAEVILTILSVGQSGVRIGISAPDDVSVYREEVWELRHGPLPVGKPA